MNRLLLVILLLLLMIAPIAAQDDSPYPVLDAADIFADGVTVIERLPVVQLSDENRTLYYFDVDTLSWREYPYPENVNRLYYVKERTDSTYVLNTYENSTNYSLMIEDTWIFDPIVGMISRPELRCGYLSPLSDDGEWELSRKNNGVYSLCHTGTEESIPLPESIEQSIACSNDPNNAAQSPNAEWIIFLNCGYIPFQIFAANTVTHEINRLSEISSGGLPSWKWVNDDTAILTMFALGSSVPLYPTFIVNVLASTIHNIGDNPDFQEDRVIWGTFEINDDGTAQNVVYELLYSTSEQNELYRYSCNVPEECLRGGITALSPSSRYLAIGSIFNRKGEIIGQDRFIIWDIVDKIIIYEEDPEFTNPISDMQWVNDNQLLLVEEASFRSVIGLYQVSNAEAQYFGLQSASWNLFLILSPNEEAIILGDEQNNNIFFYLPEMRSIPVFRELDSGNFRWDRQSDEMILIATVNYPCDLPIECHAEWHVQVNVDYEGQR